jgi:hypothetical protein
LPEQGGKMFRVISPEVEFWDFLVTMLLADGAGGLFLQVAFFDESEQERILCVAGFLIDARQSKRLLKEWNREIHEPFKSLTGEEFHMKRLQYLRLKHGFKEINKYEHKAIGLLKSRMHYATGALFNLDEAEACMTREWRERFGTIYAACCQIAMRMCGEWADKYNYQDRIAYIFESGHRDAKNADRVVKALGNRPQTRDYCRYQTHAFVDKDTNILLQAADLWAWHVTKCYLENEKGMPFREAIQRLVNDGTTQERCNLRPITGKDKLEKFFQDTFDQPWISEQAKTKFDKRISGLKKQHENSSRRKNRISEIQKRHEATDGCSAQRDQSQVGCREEGEEAEEG